MTPKEHMDLEKQRDQLELLVAQGFIRPEEFGDTSLVNAAMKAARMAGRDRVPDYQPPEDVLASATAPGLTATMSEELAAGRDRVAEEEAYGTISPAVNPMAARAGMALGDFSRAQEGSINALLNPVEGIGNWLREGGFGGEEQITPLDRVFAGAELADVIPGVGTALGAVAALPARARKAGLMDVAPGAEVVDDEAVANAEIDSLLGSNLREPVAGQRISTRLPMGPNITEDPFTQDLRIDTEAMLQNPRQLQKAMEAMSGMPQLRGSRARNPERRADQYAGILSENLVDMYERIPPEIRDMSRQWYVGANRVAQRFAERYGESLESVAGVMAALSPQMDWYKNASLAERVIDIHNNPGAVTDAMREKAGQIASFNTPKNKADTEAVLSGRAYEELTPRQKAVYIRLKDEAENPRDYRVIGPEGQLLDFKKTNSGAREKVSWGGFGEIQKAVEVLENPDIDNISRQMGNAHKVRNFYNNIVNPMSDRGDVTVDTHAVAANLLSPVAGGSTEVMQNLSGTMGAIIENPQGEFQTAQRALQTLSSGSSKPTGVVGTYGVHADAIRRAADQMGVLPREMQSITWEAVRGLFPDVFKRNVKARDAVQAIWNAHKKGDLPIEKVRDAIYEVAGGIDNPSWYDDPALAAGRDAESTFRGDEGGFVDPELLVLMASMGLAGAGAAAYFGSDE